MCAGTQVCETCQPPPPDSGKTKPCDTITEFTSYFVDEYGPVSGAQNMKAEIYARGPISCGIQATSDFENYTGGVYS